jgi:deoxyribodipyrimidine photo-lyase
MQRRPASPPCARHRLDAQHKFVFELAWREYFHHVWQQRGAGILQSLHDGPPPEQAYAPDMPADMPADIRQARTGVPVIDQAVRTLYATGYLHNHARLWLASYVVHLRKLHWRTGADWLVARMVTAADRWTTPKRLYILFCIYSRSPPWPTRLQSCL